MKCIHCNSEVSMWATVCPHCYRNPGNIIENAIIRFIRWMMVISLLLCGIMYLFVGGSSDKSTPQVNNQPVKTQEQTVQNVTKTETTSYQNSNEYERTMQQQINEQEEMKQEQESKKQVHLQQQQEKLKKEAEDALF